MYRLGSNEVSETGSLSPLARTLHGCKGLEVSLPRTMQYLLPAFAIALTLAVGSTALADGPADLGQRVGDRHDANHRASPRGRQQTERYRLERHRVDHDRGVPVAIPELDPGALGGALVLLLGGIAVLADGRRRDVKA